MDTPNEQSIIIDDCRIAYFPQISFITLGLFLQNPFCLAAAGVDQLQV